MINREILRRRRIVSLVAHADLENLLCSSLSGRASVAWHAEPDKATPRSNCRHRGLLYALLALLVRDRGHFRTKLGRDISQFQF